MRCGQYHLFPEGGNSDSGKGRLSSGVASQRSACTREPWFTANMGHLAGWKKLISIVNSPSNGITFDCGVTREMGEDPIEVCRYFASRDRINHVHFRNVQVIKPYERYREVWIDEGLNNMFAVMKELVKHKYTHLIYPEHPRRLDYDVEHGRIGGYPGGGPMLRSLTMSDTRARCSRPLCLRRVIERSCCSLEPVAPAKPESVGEGCRVRHRRPRSGNRSGKCATRVLNYSFQERSLLPGLQPG